MRNSDGLFRLIKSLKTKEIRAFRQFAGLNTDDCKYLQLFNIFNKAKSYDDINENVIMGSMNCSNLNSYYVTKNYLFELILKSLSSLQLELTLDDLIRNRVLCIKLLYEKTLFTKAYELLKKAKKLSVETENFLRLLEILKWEKNLVIEGAVKGNKEALLNKLSEEEKIALNCIGNISSYRLLSFRFNSFLKGSNQKKVTEYNRGIRYFKEHPLLNDEKNAVTLASLITFLEITASINGLLKRPDDVYKCRKRMIELLDNKPVFLKENLTNYVITLYNLTNTCFELGYMQETSQYIKRLRDITEKYADTLKLNTMMLINIGLYRLETGMDIKLNEFNKASDNSLKLYELIRKYDKVLSEAEKAESLSIAIEGLFLNKDLDESLKLIIYVNRFNTENLDPVTLIRIKLTQLLILFESGNYETAEYQAVSLQRIIKKIETTGNLQASELRSLKQVLAILKKNPSVTELITFINNMHEDQTAKKINNIFNTLLKNWVLSRTQV